MADFLTLVLAQLADNACGFIVVTGCVLSYVGLAGFSRPVANLVAGLVLIAAGMAPYIVRARRERRPRP